MDADGMYRATQARDRRFEGRFVVAVRTTGVYCRPGCPAPLPRRRNVRFYRSAAGAEAAGFRACLRCRPDLAADTPGAGGTSSTVLRALRLIDEGALDDGGLDALAARLGVGARHLRRLFIAHLGAAPKRVAITRRLHFARRLMDDGAMSVSEIALASGFGSVRRFNAAVRATFHRSPRELSDKRARRATHSAGALTVRLAYKPPYALAPMFAFLGQRAIPGVEAVDGATYRRTVRIDGEPGTITVRPADGESALEVTVSPPRSSGLYTAVERVRRIFDLGSDPAEVAGALRRDLRLAERVKRCPGLRLPGAWDPFELAVRAVLGQQVSVRAAATLAGRLVERFGTPLPLGESASPDRLFPAPEALAEADLRRIGLPRSRAEALRGLARAVVRGELGFDDPEVTRAQLLELSGVGPWTTEYIVLRALSDPDAFPAGDLHLQRTTGLGRAALLLASEAWRPFRGYAALYLWCVPDPSEVLS
jgi:AraC family transcriptional regulator of adaptative response / DNA-3-methyladenine glycosylase II